MTSELPKVANNTETDGTRSRQDIWHQNSSRARTDMSNHPMLNPYSGRTIPVRREVGESLRALDGVLSRNKVKLQLRMTERHEKKGAKRRRLASERWRNQFANEVRKKVQLVMKMRDRGA
ncbi:hypothetical protein P691DRAFT_757636 [Macrolepiota fuliginosa MF-IS2]|uniref:Ribosomal protein S21 n=1 Tax=Macrolepiota fuliginosa MF-IS2 TaxID=1400762 RepID=A0A9P5XHX9_9AGAR|nr:hypothetical protein P691DRAFT_757636 [Macrolepiota fuliginosa MF-IS2]